jgi:hypothetical protein
VRGGTVSHAARLIDVLMAPLGDGASVPSAALRAERTAKIEAGTDAGQCRTVIVFMPGRGGKGGYMGRHRDPENRPEGIL